MRQALEAMSNQNWLHGPNIYAIAQSPVLENAPI